MADAHDARLAQLKELAGDALHTMPFKLSGTRDFAKRLRDLPEAERVAMLRSCVALMPRFRDSLDDYTVGSLLYGAAMILYDMGLPLREEDLCELLRTAVHSCGHGGDVRPPFELARDHMRRHGYSATLHEAIEDYRAALPKTNSVQIQHVRRSIDMLRVLRPSPPTGRGVRPWSAAVGDALAQLDAAELAAWQHLVLSMSLREPHAIPRTWASEAAAFVERVGPDVVARRLAGFWPAEGAVVSLSDGGAQLLKHFVWLLSLLPDRDRGVELAARIPTLTWHRQDPPLGVLKPALTYLRDVNTPAARKAREALTRQIEGRHG